MAGNTTEHAGRSGLEESAAEEKPFDMEQFVLTYYMSKLLQAGFIDDEAKIRSARHGGGCLDEDMLIKMDVNQPDRPIEQYGGSEGS